MKITKQIKIIGILVVLSILVGCSSWYRPDALETKVTVENYKAGKNTRIQYVEKDYNVPGEEAYQRIIAALKEVEYSSPKKLQIFRYEEAQGGFKGRNVFQKGKDVNFGKNLINFDGNVSGVIVSDYKVPTFAGIKFGSKLIWVIVQPKGNGDVTSVAVGLQGIKEQDLTAIDVSKKIEEHMNK